MRKDSFSGAFLSSALRSIKNHRFLVGIGGVVLSLLLSLLDNYASYKSISAVFINVDGIPFYLCFIFCTYVFADCFCEDMEYRFHRNLLIRQRMEEYVFTQVTMVFATSVITMALGLLIFLSGLRLQLPWATANDSAAAVLNKVSTFRDLFYHNHYFAYFSLSSIKLGLLAACLSLAASYVSLFVKNKLLVYSTPVMLFYLIVNWGVRIPEELRYFNLYKVFMPIYNVWENDIRSALWSIAISFLLAFFLGMGIYYRMRRLVRNE